jgi:hypothetical protein
MATFNGLDIFGPHVRMLPAPNDKARQINKYPATDGLQAIDMGGMGATTQVEGWLCSDSPYDVGYLEEQFWFWQADGGAYQLFDTMGDTYENVILQTYRPASPILPVIDFTTGIAGFGRMYIAIFLHLFA